MKKLVDADEPAKNNGQLSPDTTSDNRNYCLIDDFEDSDLISPWNTTWYSFNDSKDLGSEAKIRVDAHGALDTKYALQFQYSFKGSLLQNPHCGCGLEIGNFAKTITKYHGIEFCIQSSHPNDSLELVLEVINKDGGKDYHAKIQLQGYKGKAVNSIFYYTFKKYSLTCLRIPKDTSKTQGDVWEYGAEQIYGK